MKNFNRVDIAGKLGSYNLDRGTTKSGDDYISGSLNVIVDDQGTEVKVSVFATPTWKKSGKVNGNYTMLDDIDRGEMQTGDWLSIRGSIDVDYFPPKGGSNNADDDGLARSQRIRATFLNANAKHEYQNEWRLDFLITRVREHEADEEKQSPRYVTVHGYLIDDYNERVMEVAFDARKESAMNYMLGLQCSEDVPYFVSTSGAMERITRSVVLANAFDDPEVKTYDSIRWVIKRMPPEGYAFGDEATITQEQYDQFRKGMEEYKASKKESDEGEPDLAF